jgi:DNA-binding LytR/AlgR family response regulator
MNVLIVDDEPLARRRLRKLLARFSEVVVVGEAEHGIAALALLSEEPPDLVLLDIDMPGIDGLAVARALPEGVQLVFTTAHREHAHEAFRLAAADYLLKPIDETLLGEALARVRGRLQAAKLCATAHVSSGSETLARSPSEQSTSARRGAQAADLVRIAARSGGVVELLDPARIRRLYAADKYTLCVLDGREYVLDETLQQLEERLRPHGFMRVHRRELVSVSRVKALWPLGSAAEVELDDGQRAEVSRRSLAELKTRLGLR